MALYSRDGHIADSENSQKYQKVTADLEGKECSDGAGNRRNRQNSSRRFSAVYHFFSQLVLEQKLWLIKVESYWENRVFWVFVSLVLVVPIILCPNSFFDMITLWTAFWRDVWIFLDRTFSGGSVMKYLMTVHSSFSVFRPQNRASSSWMSSLRYERQNQVKSIKIHRLPIETHW